MVQASRTKEHSLHFKQQVRQRVSECLFICAVFLGAFFWVSLLSYHHTDPGWSDTGHHGQGLLNLGGAVGAWIADVLLSAVGYVAYLWPAMLIYWAWQYWHDVREEVLVPLAQQWGLRVLRALSLLLLVFACCGLCGLFLPPSVHLPFTAGGVLGNVIALALVKEFGLTGATLGLMSVLFSSITFYSGLSWLTVADHVGRLAWGMLVWMREQSTRLTQWVISRRWQMMIDALPRISALLPGKDALALSSAESAVMVPDDVVMAHVEAPSAAKAQSSPSFGVSQSDAGFSPAPAKTAPQHPTFKPVKRSKKHDGSKPALNLLDRAQVAQCEQLSHDYLESMSRSLEAHLQDFNVDAKVVAAYPGPVVTRFELQLAPGTKASKVTALASDLARSLSVMSVRVVEIIPGKPVIGLELPNQQRQTVRLSEILSSSQYEQASSVVTLALGKDIAGYPVVVDLAKMPHLLIAGTTGSGKSVGLNAILMSLLFKSTPDELRLILIDPKMLELAIYEGIPHLLTPVVTDMKEAGFALRWCVAEMERRYRLMAAVGVRNLAGYNQKIADAQAAGEPLPDPLWQPDPMRPDEEQTPPMLEKMPIIVVMADEFADMMMVVGKKVEELIARIAQKARAAGIHLILATQRPSVDVITGLIKANIPTRISFQVSSRIDSRTVLDQQGAEQLLGHGDMLYLAPGTGVPVRVHGAFVSDEEVQRVVDELKKNATPEYAMDILEDKATDPVLESMGFGSASAEGDAEQDALYDQAVAIVLETRRASISGIQRRLKIGYNRSARLVDAMEKAGLVSAMDQSGNREVLVPQKGDH